MKRRDNKRGQVTIFIIIGIVIVAMGVLVYLFYPQIKTTLGFEETNPSAFIQECVEKEIENNLDMLSLQGGSLEPGHYILYDGEKVEYLCYTEEYYKTCVVQQPMLKRHIEEEIKEGIKVRVAECFNNLEENYLGKNYGVELGSGEMEIELLPKRVIATFNRSLVLTKEGTEKYDSFDVIVNNNIYELMSVTNSILKWETNLGDAETTNYMNYYRDLKVEKKKQTDGSTIYILTDRNNGNKFQFASRSVAWPPGYGV
ncbi:MAG: hypothetical protein ABIA78_00610 [archaeon]